MCSSHDNMLHINIFRVLIYTHTTKKNHLLYPVNHQNFGIVNQVYFIFFSYLCIFQIKYMTLLPNCIAILTPNFYINKCVMRILSLNI